MSMPGDTYASIIITIIVITTHARTHRNTGGGVWSPWNDCQHWRKKKKKTLEISFCGRWIASFSCVSVKLYLIRNRLRCIGCTVVLRPSRKLVSTRKPVSQMSQRTDKIMEKKERIKRNREWIGKFSPFSIWPSTGHRTYTYRSCVCLLFVMAKNEANDP